MVWKKPRTATETPTCLSCGEGPPKNECPHSPYPCGHHHNSVWEQDTCFACGWVVPNEEPAEKR